MLHCRLNSSWLTHRREMDAYPQGSTVTRQSVQLRPNCCICTRSEFCTLLRQLGFTFTQPFMVCVRHARADTHQQLACTVQMMLFRLNDKDKSGYLEVRPAHCARTRDSCAPVANAVRRVHSNWFVRRVHVRARNAKFARMNMHVHTYTFVHPCRC